MRENYREIRDNKQLADLLNEERAIITHCAFQNVDLSGNAELAFSHTYNDCIFIGCTIPTGLKRQTKECLFFPKMGEEFHYRSHLYTADELYEGYRMGCPDSYQQCFDGRVYRHYLKMGKIAGNIKETLARTLHDHSISDSLHAYLKTRDVRKIVGVMGGHGISRTDKSFREVVYLSKQLTEGGSIMISGGGPGAMEATHLGAWMAERSMQEVEDAMSILFSAPFFTDTYWLDTAMTVRRKYPQTRYESLGMPTWLYGHEPATPLATHIAKYFDNSIREDSILSIAVGGIIYTPGSAGTMQEIFQEAVQNHYMSLGVSSPMIFWGKDYWTKEVPVWPLLQDLVARGKYKNLKLTLTDDPDEVSEVLRRFTEENKNGRPG